MNDHLAKTEPEDPGGQLTIPIAAGENRISILFVSGRDRMLGSAVSALTLVILVFWFFTFNKPLRPAAVA